MQEYRTRKAEEERERRENNPGNGVMHQLSDSMRNVPMPSTGASLNQINSIPTPNSMTTPINFGPGNTMLNFGPNLQVNSGPQTLSSSLPSGIMSTGNMFSSVPTNQQQSGTGYSQPQHNQQFQQHQFQNQQFQNPSFPNIQPQNQPFQNYQFQNMPFQNQQFPTQQTFQPYIQQIQNLQQQILSMNTMYQQLQTQQSMQSAQSGHPGGYGKAPPVPQWSKEMSFEAWKRMSIGWNDEVRLSQYQKMLFVLESLKANKERPEISNWVTVNVSEDSSFNLNSSDALKELHARMEREFEVSKWKKAGEIWCEVLEFKCKEGENPREYLQRFNLLENKIKNIEAQVSNLFLAQHFLMRSGLQMITVQNIISKIEVNSEKSVLSDVKRKYNEIVGDN